MRSIFDQEITLLALMTDLPSSSYNNVHDLQHSLSMDFDDRRCIMVW